MDRAQAIQKVLDINRMTASSTFDGEVEVSKEMATQLRSKFDISDEDIAAAVHYHENFTLFGRRVRFFDYRRIDPHLKAIKDHIAIVLGMIANVDEPWEEMKLRQQVDLLGRFYRDLRDIVVANDSDRYHARSGQGQVRMVQGHYYAAVKAYYDALVARERSEHEARHGQERDRIRERQAQLDMDVHRYALSVMTSRDLTKAQVESIVGVHEDILSKRYWKIVEEEKGQS